MTSDFLPMDSQMLEAALSTYSKVASLVGVLAIAIFTARLSMLAVTVSGPQGFGEALKSICAFFIALALAPLVLKAIFMSTGDVAQKIASFANVGDSGTAYKTSFGSETYRHLIEAFKNKSMFYLVVFEMIPNSIGYVACAIYSLLLGALVAATPIILLYYELSDDSQSLKSVAKMSLILSSWPILWNILSLLAHTLWPSFSHTTVASLVYWSCLKLLQLLSPLFSFLFFGSLSMRGAVAHRPGFGTFSKFMSKQTEVGRSQEQKLQASERKRREAYRK